MAGEQRFNDVVIVLKTIDISSPCRGSNGLSSWMSSCLASVLWQSNAFIFVEAVLYLLCPTLVGIDCVE